MFLDDDFATAFTLSLAHALSQQVKKDLFDSWSMTKGEKCIWLPEQEVEWLGTI